jgi:hypothetical protein
VSRFATNAESAEPLGASSEATAAADGPTASARATMTAPQKVALSSSRSQVTQATGIPARRCSSARSMSNVVLP